MKYPIQKKKRKFSRKKREKKDKKSQPIPRIVIPSFFTLMNLLCGFLAIIYVAEAANPGEPQFMYAAWLIVLAGLFDAMDGFMARVANATSEFGIQLDSIADIVSFGVAPGFLVYHYGLEELQFLGVVIAALSPICGAVRLARFNVEAHDVKGDFFRGLPIPAHALIISSFYLTFSANPELFSGFKYGVTSILIPVQILVTFLMVTTIPFDKIPRFDKTSIKEHKGRYLLFIGYLIAIVLFQEYGLMAVFTMVIARGLVLGLIKFYKQAFGEDDEPEEDETVVIEDYQSGN